jgi:glycerophosphoryl diester phosphodiesterase
MKAMEDPSIKAQARRWRIGLLAAALGTCSALAVSGADIDGRAVLPATATHSGQPVGNFTAVLNNGDGSFSAVTGGDFDQGENASKVHIRVYTIRPDFQTDKGGSGKINIERFFELRDPDEKIKFPIVESFGRERILTAADFDIQSMQRAPDGTFWFGDGFGPFLIHTDKEGKVLDPPFELAEGEKAVRAPNNPNLEEPAALRVMNAYRYEARLNGHKKKLVVSPDADLLDDGDAQTAVKDRVTPPPGSELPSASSEIFNVAMLQRAGFDVIPYTVNDKARMLALMKLGVHGIISDSPDLLREALEEFDANGDGQPGDFIGPDRLVDANRFSAQAHRGGRNLRPENTIPAMEMGLDSLVNTLETDCGITQDGVPVLSHDPFLAHKKWKRTDGVDYEKESPYLIKDHTLLELQRRFVGICLTDRPTQRDDSQLSPVSRFFFEKEKGGSTAIYQIPSLDQLFRFVKCYTHYYHTGPGRTTPGATARWRNAERIRFNIETKINPRCDYDLELPATVPFQTRTADAETFARKLSEVIDRHRMTDTASIQSFDFRPLRWLHKNRPEIQTVFLFGDYPRFPDPSLKGSDDGTNMQDENGKSPWFAGLHWPYRTTRAEGCPASRGFTGLALRKDSRHLLAILGQPLNDGDGKTAPIYEFDLEAKKFTGKRYDYQIDQRIYVNDFVITNSGHGLVLESDESEAASGHRAIYEVAWDNTGSALRKKLVADLANIPAQLDSLVQTKNNKLLLTGKIRRASAAHDSAFFSIRILPDTKP